MKTWVMWTHYDCEVEVSLHTSKLECYLKLKDDWLNDCDCGPDEDCGHDVDQAVTDGNISSIADALEWHFDEMSYNTLEMEVPVSVTDALREALNPTQVNAPPERNTMPAVQADNLMARLESFSEEA
jgi:hypothetical protein